MKITTHGKVPIPDEVVAHADTIKKENYKTNTPGKFQVRTLTGCDALMHSLATLVGIPRRRLDFVYFSCCRGAEAHTDKLNPAKFEGVTYVIPVILPDGTSTIFCEDERVEVELGSVYEFDHTKVHGMDLEDNESGCVVIMVGVLKENWVKK